MNFLRKIGGWFYKDTRMVIRTGDKLIKGDKLYEVRMATIDPESKNTYHIDETTTAKDFPDMTGSYGIHISEDIIEDFMSIFDNFFGSEMDVSSQCQQITKDKGNYVGCSIGVAVNNPTIGYPYAIVIDGATGQSQRNNFYADEVHDFVLSDGRVVRVTRLQDSDVKEFRVDLDQ